MSGEITPTRTGMSGVALQAGTFELDKTAEAAADRLAISAEEIEGSGRMR